ncbi:Putative lipoprotein [Pseudoalteromonas phenolica]|uniref:Putative lipoprotein n=2 Tax=Pseudoalteromonas phenolica TaxID=161398 RepID=A0A0S2K775_9GAMM|nr:Putative lipoprotein [Pseudoalteromonas phenolica]
MYFGVFPMQKTHLAYSVVGLVVLGAASFYLSENAQASAAEQFKIDTLSHLSPYIPAQCYTKPVSTNGQVNNSCFACHTDSKRPNFLNDSDVQLSYSFPGEAAKNPWLNMFKDRTTEVGRITDDEILAYVRESNYFTLEGKLALADHLEKNQSKYDSNNNGQWDGYVPDSYFNYDHQGFDKTPEGDYTGWRTYAYYPLPGGFMPTNGSTDDVSIRLAPAFRNNEQGQFDLTVYTVNLAIVEALIKEQDIQIEPVDEAHLGVDLDKNGELTTANLVRYEWAPRDGKFMSYVGQAKQQLAEKKVHLAAKLFPEGTEFLHSVRYLDLDENDDVAMSARMKELRYAKKQFWMNYYQLEELVEKEIKERYDFPDRTKLLRGSAEEGLTVAQGWTYQGFIEDKRGALRPQTFEEQASCVGCHSGMGVLMDSNVSFYRKLPTESFQKGWYHWQQKSFAGTPDRIRETDGQPEYSYYLMNNPTGDEFRANHEVKAKFFDQEGKPKPAAFARLQQDISYLLLPSKSRALELNKAYKVIVDEQSYIHGKAPIVKPLDDVMHKQVEVDQETGITQTLNAF